MENTHSSSFSKSADDKEEMKLALVLFTYQIHPGGYNKSYRHGGVSQKSDWVHSSTIHSKINISQFFPNVTAMCL